MSETADRVLGGCRIAVLLATAVIQAVLSLPRLGDTAGRSAFVALAVVLVVAAWWVLRWKPVPWPVALAGAVVVLAASTVAVWTLPPDQLLGGDDWASGLAGWHLLVLLLDRPALAMGALVLQMTLTFSRQIGSAPADRGEIGGLVIVGLSVLTFQAATLALIRVVNRRVGEAAEASAERDRQAHRKALAEEREADQRSRFAGQLGATLPLLAGLADHTLDPRDEAVRRRCALAATQLRRLFAENDDVPDPLLHEVSACVDLAERRGLTVTLAVSGEPAPIPTGIRRELTGPLMTALVAARSQARVSVLRTDDEIRVAAITDGEPGATANGSGAVDVEWHALGERSWMEAKWRSRPN
ncbi:histidine kinase [Amycolatopsis sp. WAC 01376]|uniref:histidine kinase n=1 Tax=Amycolatopsis sp. WAC 01376 TaxID=2203195 RepID=UPI000F7B8EA5|nr:histidine kinase [Amycolatopsis sp. WAC 01376]RSM59082.1 histidine kinase [Amycolatopsis sp. WAC 01376]